MPNGRKKYNQSLVVTDRMYDTFNARCVAALEKVSIVPMETAIPILGTSVLQKETSVPTYLARLRAFVSFLLVHPDYDESLAVFYPFTPKGTVTCQETAVSHFLLSKFEAKARPHRSSARPSLLRLPW